MDPSSFLPSGLTAQDWFVAGAIVLTGLVLALIVHRIVVVKVARRSERRAHVARLVGRFTAMVIFLAGVVMALTSLGVQIGPLLGALGIIGLALAFSLQDFLKNLIAGITLQASSPFKPGDQIVVGTWSGTVEDVDFRTVVLRTFDDTRVHLPSAYVAEEPIQTLTAFAHRLTVIEVEVAYGTDVHFAREVLTTAVRGAQGVVPHPEAGASMTGFEDSGIRFAVYFWHRSRRADLLATRHQVYVAVNDALRDANIEIPFPQRTVWFPEDPDTDDAGPDMEQ